MIPAVPKPFRFVLAGILNAISAGCLMASAWVLPEMLDPDHDRRARL